MITEALECPLLNPNVNCRLVPKLSSSQLILYTYLYVTPTTKTLISLKEVGKETWTLAVAVPTYFHASIDDMVVSNVDTLAVRAVPSSFSY